MSIFDRISYQVQKDGSMDISVPPELTAEFKQMIRRATNTWQDQSSELRDFVDRVFAQDGIMGCNMKHGHSLNSSKKE